ncbi:MAG: Crp/Fnr family transcriptional regulator [Bacteroidaceae bacterium]|nr:Crp/Fnr family transcriptional regulator [Bacteroidaceae bacterium]MBP5645777.1 Crp/Fnr family transcriptional regulator [Bacteroidaceae bacterium]
MDSPIFDTLKQLPLFQGMANDDFNTLLQKIRLDFVKYPPGSFICSAGDRCSHFTFLIGGTAESSRRGESDRFVFHEKIGSPHLIEPYSMFGATGSYRRDYEAVDTCSVLNVDKQYVYTEIGKYNICRMNLLNILSGRVQQADRHTWEIDEFSLRHRIARLIYGLSDIPYGEKRLSITMNDLAALMDTTRLNVSRELNALSADGLIVLRRKEIHIPALEKITG